MIGVTGGVQDSAGTSWPAQSLAGSGRTIMNNGPTHSSAAGAWPSLAASRDTASSCTGHSLSFSGDGGNRNGAERQGDRGRVDLFRCGSLSARDDSSEVLGFPMYEMINHIGLLFPPAVSVCLPWSGHALHCHTAHFLW